MNKLLMLAFLVTLMGLMATATPQEDVEELELEDYNEDEADSLEEVAESREVREAGRNREPCRGRKNCRNNRPKAGRSGKKRTRNGKEKIQKKSAKKNKKSKNNKPKKSIKGERRGNGVSRSQCRSSTDYTCLISAMTYLNLTKTQVTNYLKQQGRIVAANKTGEKKNGKKGIFASTAQRIIR